jgi:endonuclease-3
MAIKLKKTGGAAARPPVKVRKVKPAAAWTPDRIQDLLARLRRAYPDARCALNHETPLQLLLATILSAQCTDERVNKVTPGLFARWNTAAAFALADRAELEQAVQSTGFFRAKARSIQECCRDIVEKHGGEVPARLEDLTQLRGVGRKTANVVLGNAFGIPGITVDTHVGRLSRRLGLTREEDPVKVEFALMEWIPRKHWTLFSHLLIHHGRRVCASRKPLCSACPLADLCPRVGVSVSA